MTKQTNDKTKYIKNYIVAGFLCLGVLALIILGCALAGKATVNFKIRGQEVNIHLYICILLTWTSIICSIFAINKFRNDIGRIYIQEENVLNENKYCSAMTYKMFVPIGLGTLLPIIVFSVIAWKIVLLFNYDKPITIYILVLAIIYIITMLTAFGSALYIILKISSIFSEDFKDYEKKYPIATPIFKECYRIFFHGIVLFWIIGILLFILISLLCLNTAADGMDLDLNKYTIGTAYVSIVVGFILSTIYPYYITKRKVEELKLKSINNLSKSSSSYDDDIKHIKESPNNIDSNTSVRVYSTLTIIISFIVSICTLING